MAFVVRTVALWPGLILGDFVVDASAIREPSKPLA